MAFFVMNIRPSQATAGPSRQPVFRPNPTCRRWPAFHP